MLYYLTEELVFPPPQYATRDGILAVGGDLRPERLLLAYQSGIFPWYSEGEPVLWWCPNPRFIMNPQDLKVSKSMKQVLRKGTFEITYDQNFKEVIKACSSVPREGQMGTWIVEEMLDAYSHLHQLGFAHSVEAWKDGELVGGLYGVAIGNVFFGESMFAKASNASKAAFITLVGKLTEHNFKLIDSQVYTPHLASLGCIEISRNEYLDRLKDGIQYPTLRGNWGEIL